MKIREAGLTDAAGIAKVHVDSWRTTYKSIIPDNYLDKLSYEQRSELWIKNISESDNYVIVAETDEGDIIGFATANKRDENTSDLTSIYLLEEYQGHGVGKQLLKDLFKYFKKEGCQKVYVEVLEDNKTKFFYEHYGAEFVKTVQIKIGGKTLNESIYAWNQEDLVFKKSLWTYD